MNAWKGSAETGKSGDPSAVATHPVEVAVRGQSISYRQTVIRNFILVSYLLNEKKNSVIVGKR